MATVQIFNSFKAAAPNKIHNLATDVLKYMLTDTAPVLTNSVKANLVEIAAGNGYTAGGTAVTVTSSAQTGGTYSLALAACTFTATPGAFAPFRYIVLYNDTALNDELIGFIDYGISYTLPAGQPFTIEACTFLTNA